ncbi:cytochrome P450 [Streptomyces sp. TRM68367]|uniref:cytochrome P450 n=1 Tax=Streptomyces sp. TRM68367 TaxID=2758415 RepID=UPI00165BF242|nr:cytochrome P450 [Streptomyces sp. TRM68367]MBC9724754.1 cytochrome P450 [Streptomyces sp. TRM68367]
MEDVREYAAALTVEDLDRDPYPVYARLRREAPVAWVPAVGLWFVTRWRDVERVATDTESFTAALDDSPLDHSFGSPTILTVDGDVHMELRRSLDAKYRPRAVASYIDDLVGPLVEERIAALRGRDRAELMTEYFEPISVLSLGRVLGLGDLPADTLRSWFSRLSDGATNFEKDPRKQARSDGAAREIDQHVGALMTRLATAPDDSTVSHMLHTAMPPGRCRAREFVMPSFKVILLGGMQEPGHGGGTVVAGLLASPGQAAAVRADLDEMVPRAVEEGLRWVAPIGTQTRQTAREVELAGVTLPAGAPVAAVVSSASRDEELFDAPDTFNVFRAGRNHHAAFGFGRHFCTGHAFARHQLRLALRGLLEAFPNLRLDPEHPPVFRGWEFRAPRNLDVLLS